MHVNFDPDTKALSEISFDQFLSVDMRVGEIIEALDFPEARNPSYKLKIDFGAGVGIKKSSAQITENYSIDQLIGKKVLAVVNFAPRQIAKFMSEVLVLGVSDIDGNIILFDMNKNVPNGSRLL